MRTKELFNFIRERESIRLKRLDGESRPWTKNKILQSYRFCNVHREDDTVTKWIAKHWRYPHRHDKDLWFAMVVARLVNWPESLEEIGYPVPFSLGNFVNSLEYRKENEEKIFTAAYMVRADANKTGSKAAYLAKYVLTPMWNSRREIRPVAGDTLATFYDRLTQYRDMGSFMAGQVVADIKYVGPLKSAEDWYTWAVSGPGSRRGLNRVMGRPLKAPWKEYVWFKILSKLRVGINTMMENGDADEDDMLHAQDVQSCLCEWDKYERVRLGEGRPRSKYDGRGQK